MTIEGDALVLRFGVGEKVGGLVRDLAVPVRDIDDVELAPDGLAAARGLRAPGLGVPGVRKVGHWRRRGRRSLVSVRRDQPAVRLRVRGHRFDELVIGLDDAAARVQVVRDAVGRTRRASDA